MLLHSIISEMDIFYTDEGCYGELPQHFQRRHGYSASFVKEKNGERICDFFSTDPKDYLNKGINTHRFV